ASARVSSVTFHVARILIRPILYLTPGALGAATSILVTVPRPPRAALCPYTALFRAVPALAALAAVASVLAGIAIRPLVAVAALATGAAISGPVAGGRAARDRHRAVGVDRPAVAAVPALAAVASVLAGLAIRRLVAVA